MKRFTCLLTVLSLLSPALAMATIHSGTIDGDEAQATGCAIGSTSRSVGSVTYDDVTHLFTWSFSFGDNAPSYDDGALFGGAAATLGHFHGPAAPGMGAGVVVTTGTATPNNSSATISAGEGADLLNELWYLNIHSSLCGSGEVRGQVLFPAPVPSLSTYGALLLVLCLLGATLWKLRRAQGSIA